MPVRFVPVLGIRAAICISIHAPGWGATVLCNRQTIIIKPFQSTHPHGVRRATSVISSAFGGNFNPRTRVGCDSKAQGQAKSSFEFQSTHPGGVRQKQIRTWVFPFLFQSTHPGGVRRSANNVKEYWKEISIHAPGWGATLELFDQNISAQISIHAPGWGATARPADHGRQARISIHAPGWGATLTGLKISHRMNGISIHAPGWGATGGRLIWLRA